jgi:hypothetical protein
MTDDSTAVAVASEVLPPSTDGEALPERRPPGRPKGSKNRDRVATIERILSECDPIGFRCRALRTGRIRAAPSPDANHRQWIYLTKDEILDLARDLERKVIPDLRAVEVSGPDGNPIQTLSLIDFLRALPNE